MPDRYSSREIFRILEEEILSLKIAPGESLSENELCERFGVSRSPIRSVLQELRMCDLVSITPYKRTQVTRMNFSIINQLIYQRIAVETFVLEDFIRILNVLELERLRHIHNSMIELIQTENYSARNFYALDSKLHATWFSATRKEYLWDTIQTANCHYTRFRMLDIVHVHELQPIVEDHEAILRALESADVAAIRPLMQKHLNGGITRLGKLLFSDLKGYFTEN